MPRLRPAAFAMPLAGLAACASTPASRDPILRDPLADTPVTTRIDGMGGAVEVALVYNPDRGLETPGPAGPDKAYSVLPEVYESFGLAINTALANTRTVGVREGRAPRRLGKRQLSEYLDCGAGPTGPHADSYSVVLTALSRVTASADSASVVLTQVTASAVPHGTSGTRVRCASNGRLEGVINKAVALRAAAR